MHQMHNTIVQVHASMGWAVGRLGEVRAPRILRTKCTATITTSSHQYHHRHNSCHGLMALFHVSMLHGIFISRPAIKYWLHFCHSFGRFFWLLVCLLVGLVFVLVCRYAFLFGSIAQSCSIGVKFIYRTPCKRHFWIGGFVVFCKGFFSTFVCLFGICYLEASVFHIAGGFFVWTGCV